MHCVRAFFIHPFIHLVSLGHFCTSGTDVEVREKAERDISRLRTILSYDVIPTWNNLIIIKKKIARQETRILAHVKMLF